MADIIKVTFSDGTEYCYKSPVNTFLAVLRKIILLIPLIFLLPNFFEDKAMAVFLAEPVADVIAVTTTVCMFTFQFRKTMKELNAK